MTPLSCLIVDDSKVIRRVARHMLESYGVEVAEAEEGREALSHCEASMPDVILLDWHMPGMGGMEFLRAVRRMEGGMSPRVVVCTSQNELNQVLAAIDAGADDYLVKPFSRESLGSKVQAPGAVAQPADWRGFRSAAG